MEHQQNDSPRHTNNVVEMQLPTEDLIVSLWPMYSRLCRERKKMVVYATNPVDLKMYTFDRDTLTFVDYFCQCSFCRLIPHMNELGTPGTKGILHQASHFDEKRNRLMCISMSWENEYHGQLDVFVRADGCIGKYFWNEEKKCFSLEQQFDVFMEAQQKLRIDEVLAKDSDVVPEYYYNCKNLGAIFRSDKPAFRNKKYVFNFRREQLEEVECRCSQCDPVFSDDADPWKPLLPEHMVNWNFEIRDSAHKSVPELHREWNAELEYRCGANTYWCGPDALWHMADGPVPCEHVHLMTDMRGRIAPFTKTKIPLVVEKFQKHEGEDAKEEPATHDEIFSEMEMLGFSLKEDSFEEDDACEEDDGDGSDDEHLSGRMEIQSDSSESEGSAEDMMFSDNYF